MHEFSLANRFDPSSGRATLRLSNAGNVALSGLILALSGPSRIAAGAVIEGAKLVSTISNHAELAPDATLNPGGQIEIVVSSGYSPRHWTDGPTGAYLVLSDGTSRPVHVHPLEEADASTARLKGTMPLPTPEAVRPDAPVSIVPWPAHVEIAAARECPQGLAPLSRSKNAENAGTAFAELTASLFPGEAVMRGRDEGGLPVYLADADGFGPEAYRIDFAPEAATIRATTQTGFLYGLITLGQVWRGAKRAPQAFVFPAAGSIVDEPRMGWRGSHLDTARQFYAVGEIAQFLNILAWNKLNRFHWHLSDDEAFRLEIRAFPELTETAAWRGHGQRVPSLLGSSAEPMGGVYTQESVRALDSMARSLGIVIVPEIDIPGHSFALLAAMPRLRDPDEIAGYRSVQGFPDNCLNPALPETYAVLERIIGEVAGLFSGRILHIGADEVPLGAWSGSPRALDRLAELSSPDMRERHAARLGQLTNHHGADDIEGSPTAILQAEFIKKVDALIAARGMTTGGWEEAAHGDAVDKLRSYLVGWRDPEVSRALAARGYDIVVAPGQRYYLDMANGPDFHEPGASWAGWSGPAETYAFDPLDGWSDAERRHCLGVQACIWSEPMTDRAVFDRLVFPRLSAIAETGWTPHAAKDFSRFIGMAGLMPTLYGHAETTLGRTTE
jgi:hexosaminidase